MDMVLYCPACGYQLQGSESPTCPECGEEVDRASLQTTQLPWAMRDRYGRFAGFWRTVWLVSFRPKRYAMEAARPVDPGHARSFRWITLGLAWLTLMLSAAAVVNQMRDDPIEPLAQMLEFHGTGWLYVLLAIGVLLWLAAVTRLHLLMMPGKRVEPERRRRMYFLGYYAVAPLAWWVASVPVLVMSIRASEENFSNFRGSLVWSVLLVALMIASAAVTLLGYPLAASVWNKRIACRGIPGRFLWLLTLILGTPLLAGLLLAALPGLVLYCVLLVRLLLS